VLRALASLYHQEDDNGGLWVLTPHDDDPIDEDIKRLHRLFNDLDSAEIDRLNIATGRTNPTALAAMLARDLLTLTAADLETLPFRDRLRVENEIMMARYEQQTKPPSPSLPPRTHMPTTPAAPATALKHEDFWAYSPAHSYIFGPTGEHWPASTVNSRLAPVIVQTGAKPIPAASYLDKTRSVEQATWAPGQPQIIEDRLIADGGWIERAGYKTFNLLPPPTIKPKVGDVAPWVNHVRWFYPDEAEHLTCWLAQRVQHPDVKINHALVLGGNQGVGKDTLLEPVKAAVGPWNCSEVSPQQMLGRFNGFVKSVILRISEARDLGDTDRYGFYEHTKTLTAAPPDVLRVDEKHLREYAVLNVVGCIVTTNNKDSFVPAGG